MPTHSSFRQETFRIDLVQSQLTFYVTQNTHRLTLAATHRNTSFRLNMKTGIIHLRVVVYAYFLISVLAQYLLPGVRWH
jgi:hypothetical protein